MRIRRIEAITDAGDRASLQRLMMREFERRTGQLVLPLDLENDVRAAFGDESEAPPVAGEGPDGDGPADPPGRKGRKR
jgi:hypothetical protein